MPGLLDFLFNSGSSSSNPILDKMTGYPEDPNADSWPIGQHLQAFGSALQGDSAASASIMNRMQENREERKRILRRQEIARRILTKRKDLIDRYIADPDGFAKYYYDDQDAQAKTKEARQYAEQKRAEDWKHADEVAARQLAEQEKIRQAGIENEKVTNTREYLEKLDEERRAQSAKISEEQRGYGHESDIDTRELMQAEDLRQRVLHEDPKYQFRERQAQQLGQTSQDILSQVPGAGAQDMPQQRGSDYMSTVALRQQLQMPDLTQAEAQQYLAAAQSSPEAAAQALQQIKADRKDPEWLAKYKYGQQDPNFRKQQLEDRGSGIIIRQHPDGTTETIVGGSGGSGGANPVPGINSTDNMTEGTRRNVALKIASQPGYNAIMDNWEPWTKEAFGRGVEQTGLPGGMAALSERAQAANTGFGLYTSNWMYIVSGAAQQPEEMSRVASNLAPRTFEKPMSLNLKKQTLMAMNEAMNELTNEPRLQEAVRTRVNEYMARTGEKFVPYEVVSRIMDDEKDKLNIKDPVKGPAPPHLTDQQLKDFYRNQ